MLGPLVHDRGSIALIARAEHHQAVLSRREIRGNGKVTRKKSLGISLGNAKK